MGGYWRLWWDGLAGAMLAALPCVGECDLRAKDCGASRVVTMVRMLAEDEPFVQTALRRNVKNTGRTLAIILMLEPEPQHERTLSYGTTPR